MTDKATRARTMLAEQHARLTKAIALLSHDKLDLFQLNEAKAMLRRVEHWQNDLPEMALGFMGPNGFGPLIDHICNEADKRAPGLAVAA